MHQDILREMRTEILNVKKDSMTWQTEAARSQEVRTSYTDIGRSFSHIS